VETLGNFCFCKCKSLSTVTFKSHSQLSSIGESVFSICSSLSSICIPSSLQTVLKEYRALLNARHVVGVAEGDALVLSGD
jgi:hypothetical protein